MVEIWSFFASRARIAAESQIGVLCEDFMYQVSQGGLATAGEVVKVDW